MSVDDLCCGRTAHRFVSRQRPQPQARAHAQAWETRLLLRRNLPRLARRVRRQRWALAAFGPAGVAAGQCGAKGRAASFAAHPASCATKCTRLRTRAESFCGLKRAVCKLLGLPGGVKCPVHQAQLSAENQPR